RRRPRRPVQRPGADAWLRRIPHAARAGIPFARTCRSARPPPIVPAAAPCPADHRPHPRGSCRPRGRPRSLTDSGRQERERSPGMHPVSMTSLATLATLAHAAPAAQPFNATFYATVATVIPVLFLALAVQGRLYEDLLKPQAAL